MLGSCNSSHAQNWNLGRVRVVVGRERGRKIQACKNPHQIVKRIWFKKLGFSKSRMPCTGAEWSFCTASSKLMELHCQQEQAYTEVPSLHIRTSSVDLSLTSWHSNKCSFDTGSSSTGPAKFCWLLHMNLLISSQLLQAIESLKSLQTTAADFLIAGLPTAATIQF